MADNRPVVNEEKIGNATQPIQRFQLIGANRFIAQIAAGGDDGKIQLCHQQMMQRIGRQHDAEAGIAGSDGMANGR